MDISANKVKELREITQAGMMDCKKALVESNGDMDKAIDYLREKGISKAAKKADRIAAEGLTNIFVKDEIAVLVEVNSETDFVAKNDEFKNLVDIIGNSILNNEVSSLEDVNNLKVENNTISELIINATAKIGEKISLRRYEKIIKKENEIFGTYLHMGGKISSLVILTSNAEVAKDIAMQSAAMRPLYLNIESVPNDVIEHEKSIITEQLKEEGAKMEYADKIIEGRLRKYFEEVCLVEQSFIKDQDITIKKYLENNNTDILKMVRYEMGEGLEKRSENFAEEVQNQLNN